MLYCCEHRTAPQRVIRLDYLQRITWSLNIAIKSPDYRPLRSQEPPVAQPFSYPVRYPVTTGMNYANSMMRRQFVILHFGRFAYFNKLIKTNYYFLASQHAFKIDIKLAKFNLPGLIQLNKFTHIPQLLAIRVWVSQTNSNVIRTMLDVHQFGYKRHQKGVN